MLPGKTSRAGSSADADWTNSIPSSSSELHLLKERGYLTPSPQPKGLSTLFDSCHKAPALQNKLCRLSGQKRTWNNSREIEVFLQNTMQCSFCLRKCRSFFPQIQPSSPAGLSVASFWTGHEKIQEQPSWLQPSLLLPPSVLLPAFSSSSPQDHLTFSHPHNFYTIAHTATIQAQQSPSSCHIRALLLLQPFFQQQCDTAECLLCPALRIWGIFQSPQTVSWLLKSQLEEHMCCRANTLF